MNTGTDQIDLLALVTPAQLAKERDVTVTALSEERRSGRGPKYMKLGRFVRYRRKWIEEFYAQNTVDPSRR